MTDQDPNSPKLVDPDRSDRPTGRRWPVASSVFSGLVSMVVHAALMIGLGLLTLPAQREAEGVALVAGDLDWAEEFATQELDPLLEPAAVPEAAAAFTAPEPGGRQPEELSIDPVDIEAADITVALTETVLPNPQMDLLSQMGSALQGTDRAVVAGSQQAVDRITDELIRLLLTRNVLLIWCFDQSNSIQPDREDIRSRVRKIYAELGASPFAQGEAVLTAVTSFGQGFMVHTQRPTDNFEEIEAAIDAVPVDESGLERVCQAVNRAVETHRRYASERLETDAADQPAPKARQDEPFASTRQEIAVSQRQLVLILVTDESGEPDENLGYLEKTIDTAKRANCRVYVMGREASFGHPYTTVRYTDPENKITWTIDDVRRGPETAHFEVLQFDGFARRPDIHLSGFGPYDLVRLAKETGGTYFLLPDKSLSQEEAERRQRQMDQMRNYVPETDSRPKYVAARSLSPLRQTIWQVVSDFDAWDDQWLGQIRFLRSLPADEARLTSQAKSGLSPAKDLLRDYQTAIDSLERVEKFRADEPRRRWQANYDLLLAQMVAYRARTAEYVACLDAAAGGPPAPKEPPKPDTRLVSWSIRNTQELFAEEHKADVDRATQLLSDVIKNHPDTPWASRAAWELKRPFGYGLVGVYRPVPKPVKVAAKPKPPRPKPTPPKPAKPKPKPVKPKL